MQLTKRTVLQFMSNGTHYEVDMELVNRDETVDMRITLINGRQFTATQTKTLTIIEPSRANGSFGSNQPF